MFLIAASAIALVPVAADDMRLTHDSSYVSQAAQSALGAKDTTRVLCLDRGSDASVRHICLTEQEWNEAIRLAESVDRRERLITLSAFYAGQSGTNVTSR